MHYQMIWEKQVDAYVNWKVIREENITKAYSLILRQFMEVLRQKLQILDTNKRIYQSADGNELLISIKTMIFKFEGKGMHPRC